MNKRRIAEQLRQMKGPKHLVSSDVTQEIYDWLHEHVASNNKLYPQRQMGVPDLIRGILWRWMQADKSRRLASQGTPADSDHHEDPEEDR